MRILGRGRILMWQGGSLWIMEAATAGRERIHLNDAHSHHAVQVTLALEGSFEFTSGSQRRSGPVAAVATDAIHSFKARGLFAHLYIEPESLAGRAAAAALFSAAEPLAQCSPALLGDLPAQLSTAFRMPGGRDAELARLGQAIISRLAGTAVAQGPDARIRRILDHAMSHLDERLGLTDAAKLVGLSRNRVRHLFVEQTGLPLRTYLLWLRLTRGLESYAQGTSLTEAAHESGFSDSAHFSRTFRRMFGTAAAALQLDQPVSTT